MNLNLSLLLPELTLVVTGMVVLLTGVISKDRFLLPVLAAIGLAVALVESASLAYPLLSITENTPPSMIAELERNIFSIPGMLINDGFTGVFRMLLAGSTLLLVLGTTDYVMNRLQGQQGEFYAMLLFACASMMLLTSAMELITLYVALETSSIALYALAGFLRDKKSSEAGIKYLALGGISSALLLYGMVIFFGITGSTSFQDILQSLAGSYRTNVLPIVVGVVLLVAGFGFKIAAFPFQMWVPDVYEGAPTPVTAFLSVVSKAAGFAVVLRLFHIMLGLGPIAGEWHTIFAALAALTMTFGNVVALQQRNIKRLMGYSSVAQAGYLLVGVSMVQPVGAASVVLFLISYAVTNVAAFIAIIALTEAAGTDEISGLRGAAQRSPLVAGCLALALLSLTGIPPTAGFFAKLTVFGVALSQQGMLWLVLLGAVNSVISAFYYIGIIKAMYVNNPEQTERQATPWLVQVPLFIATALTFAIGVSPQMVLDGAIKAVQLLP